MLLLQLNQKTPLRVLHRRSLLDRKRHVYKIETALLNKHFFLMRLVTSAGALLLCCFLRLYCMMHCTGVRVA